MQKHEWAVLAFTASYVVGFGIYFISIGNNEFLWYIATLIGFMLLIAYGARRAQFPAMLLWLLSIWGLAHMAGGGVVIDGAVLYAYRLLDIVGTGELSILKYDQVVHFYGFGVTALVLRHLLRRNFPVLAGTATLFCYPILGSMGLGGLNEIIEFAAVMALPNTNVGGYYNTALDLLFNTAGAITAVALITKLERSA